MKIIKNISCTLVFDNETLCDYYLASALYKYIAKRNKHLEEHIGYSNDNNPNGINDFLYYYSNNDQKICNEIESHIKQFVKDFDLVSDALEQQCKDELISDDNEFYDKFKKLSKVYKEKKNLDEALPSKGKDTRKIKI
jgi:hypothetical protein